MVAERGPDASTRLGARLVEENIITGEQLQDAVRLASEKKMTLDVALVQLGYVSKEVIRAFQGMLLNLEFIELEKFTVQKEAIKAIPAAICKKWTCIPVEIIDGTVKLAIADPMHIYELEDIGITAGVKIEPFLSSDQDIRQAIQRYYGGKDTKPAAEEEQQATPTAAAEEEELEASTEDLGSYLDTLSDAHKVEVMQEEEASSEELEKAGEQKPVVKMVNAIIAEAVRREASDIHLESYEKSFRVRYRLDGVLQNQKAPPRRLQGPLIARIKILSNLDVAERRLPQDGRIRMKVLGKQIDFRVSIIPVVGGEKVCMRILDSSGLNVDMTKLGFMPEHMSIFQKCLEEPYGMIMITGPTGSGKSTTLYSALASINKPDINISTIEDPIEYNLPGINQMAANKDIGLDFARGLHSFLRQDPDVILIGEVRDKETAEVVVEAALTGHLVFGTLHTNDAPGAVTRLINMGIEPFLVTSTLLMAMGQRLMRVVCASCKEAYEASDKEQDIFKVPAGEKLTLYKGAGCATCNDTGYKGRTAIHEIMMLTDELRRMVTRNEPTEALKQKAIEEGMMTLRQVAERKVKEGITSVEELLRVTKED